jgi:uncharacterized membrane protein
VRGFWLIVLEFTLVRWGWQFHFRYDFVGLLVIWALGWSMIALAVILWLPRWAILAVGGGMVLLHNLTDPWSREGGPLPEVLWGILHVPRPIELGWVTLFPGYTLIPWIGVMALGYLFGGWMSAAPEVRRRRCLWLGVACLAAFALLRPWNLYGDSWHWQAVQGRPWYFTAFSFVNTSKYPPSLLYLLMTLGPMFLLLAAFEGWRSTRDTSESGHRWSPIEMIRSALLVFGRVPLFFYLLHLPLIHGPAILNAWLRIGPRPEEMDVWSWRAKAGYDLPMVYVVWFLVIVILYPLCARYDAYKRTRRGGWTRYL